MHLLLAQLNKFSQIFCLDVNEFRLNFAKKFNLTSCFNSADDTGKQKVLERTNQIGVDVVIVATSNLKALEDAFDLVRKGGTIMMFGVPSKNSKMTLDINKIYSKEISLTNSYSASDYDTKEALALIESSKIDVKSLITHTYSIQASQKAFDHAKSGDGAMKIIITK
jgi:L-iditol 2-dehydrogenase